jgi:hypothetical protein
MHGTCRYEMLIIFILTFKQLLDGIRVEPFCWANQSMSRIPMPILLSAYRDKRLER